MTMPNSRFFSLVLTLLIIISISGCASIKENLQGITSKSAVVKSEEPTSIETITIQFSLESAVLDQKAKSTLDALSDRALEHAPAQLVITGFTDITGSERYNKKLSIQRAMAVKRYLDSLPLNEIYIVATGQGETSPIADNNVRSGRQQNRRAEIILLKL